MSSVWWTTAGRATGEEVRIFGKDLSTECSREVESDSQLAHMAPTEAGMRDTGLLSRSTTRHKAFHPQTSMQARSCVCL